MIFRVYMCQKLQKTWFSTPQMDCKLCMFHRPSFTKYRKNHEKPQKLDKISEQKCVQNDHIFDKKSRNIQIKNSQTCANGHHSAMYDAVPEGEIMIIIVFRKT